MRVPLLILAALLAASPGAVAQPLVPLPGAEAFPEAPPDSFAVSLLTMMPGTEVYSLFGHSAIRIQNPALGVDRTYNFGTFDFDQPFFLVRFARGQLDYILDTAPFADELAKYEYLGRPIIEQRLALSTAAAQALYEQLETNALPENRAYRYDFLFDNCSTRLLDAIDRAVTTAGRGPIRLAPAATHPTFREMLAPYIQGTPTLALGMNLGIGVPSDRVATDREQAFLPVSLAATLDRASAGGSPLVVSRDTLFWVPGAGQVPDRTEWLVPAILALLAAGWLAALLGRASLGRAADVTLFGLAGLMGIVVAFLWFFTDHTVTGPNLNLLWAFPGHLGLAVVARRARVSGLWRAYAGLTAASGAAALVVHAAGVQALPLGALLLAAAVGVRAALIASRRGAASVS